VQALRPAFHRPILVASQTLVVLIVAGGGSASAQGKLEAKYEVSLAGVTIGKGSLVAEIGGDQYSASASGEITGILRVFGSAEGSAAARGTVKDGVPVPTSYAGHLTTDDGDEDVRMTLDSGTVTDLVAESAQPPSPDRVPVTELDRHGVIDPISAGLIPSPGAADADVLSPEACRRILPVFDGHQRFNVMLSYKRMDVVKPKKGYNGAALVCAVRYDPLAGYRPGLAAVKYLIAARDVELWLVPIAGTRILAPARISIPTLIGTALVEADQLVVRAPPVPAASSGPKPP